MARGKTNTPFKTRSKPKSKARSDPPPALSAQPDSDSEFDSSESSDQTSDTVPPKMKIKHESTTRSTKNAERSKYQKSTPERSSDSTPPPAKKSKRVSMPAKLGLSKSVEDALGGMTAQQIKALAHKARRQSAPMRLGKGKIGWDEKEDDEEGEEGHEEEAVDILQGLEEDEDEDEEELREKAKELADSLIVPFQRLEDQSITSLTTSLTGMTSTLRTALEPFHGGAILQQLEIWHQQEGGVIKVGIEGWDKMMELVKKHKEKFDNMTGRIETAVGEKTKIVAQGKEDADAAVKRQSAELKAIRSDLAKSKVKWTKKMKNCEDQGVMKKEIEMAVNDILDPFDGEK